MGNLNIKTLINFEIFSNLKYIWLNGNKLTSIKALKNNKKIIELYLHDNLFEKLELDVFTNFKYLKKLTLNDN